ncbi:hypothetical protein [Massilia sp. YIM B02443]|uniref:hypothetical protein n=1 Tax=Massilia sp. YIM B02443 TaxID=3050127 RepID=UPI0025B66265|nr:hypothetical protein [Massilia sp. YIM B02443]MDN4039286.1 hypothetical protein [Massilia sp. YIM B02443]
MQKGWERWVIGTLAVGIVAVGSAWILRPVEPVAPAVAPARAVQAAKPDASWPAAAPAQVAQVVAASFLDAAAPPLREQVERLLASSDPQQAYTAYLLVSVCSQFNQKGDVVRYDDDLRTNRGLNADERKQISGMCGAMTERERLARLDHLALAVKAGVPGAAWAWAAEGPFGDPSALTTRPDDPLVKEWKAAASAQVIKAAEAGDTLALLIWGMQSIYGSDLAERQPQLGFGYLLAMDLIAFDRLGPNHPKAKDFENGSALTRFLESEAKLTPEQRAAAVETARHIVDKVKAQRRGGASGPSDSAL